MRQLKRNVEVNLDVTPNPTVNICINKSRLKTYNKDTKPTHYLNDGTEFSFELYNPTCLIVLARIKLNGVHISQGGIVLRPAERIFLERYIDTDKKFKFETYEVSNSDSSKKAIINNGEFSVEFYKEHTFKTSNSSLNLWDKIYRQPRPYWDNPILCGNPINLDNTVTYGGSYVPINTISYGSNLSINSNLLINNNIETGRVTEGSKSSQNLKNTNDDFDIYCFHKIEGKLLPISERINNNETIRVKQYCGYCGTKLKENFKFCPSCGEKI